MPLVGRTQELAALDEALAALERGTPRAVEVIGPAGIGKSRLFAELAARADARGHLVLEGSAAELEQDLPFWIFVDALDRYVKGLDPRRLERLDPSVRAELGQVLPSLAEAGPAERPALHERYRVHRAMIELLEQLATTMNYEAMRGWGERAAAAAGQLDDDALRAAALAAAARGAAVPGASAEAETLRAEAAALIDGMADDVLARRLDAATHLAGAELYLHRFAEAHAHADRALAVGRATGQGQQFPLVFPILGITWFFEGQPGRAVEPLEGAVEAARLSGNVQTLAWSLYARSRIAMALGDVPLALTAGQEAVDLIDDGRPSHHLSHAAWALAEAELEIGKPERTVELLERSAGGAAMPLVAESFRAFCLELLVRGRLALGHRQEAERAAEEGRASADQVGLPLATAWADRAAAAAALDAGSGAGAADLALRAAATADAVGTPLEAALARTLAGRALAHAGDRQRAREVLERAAGELQRIGAIRHRDAAERELRRIGHRIHRRSQPAAAEGDGVAGLTKRELEIARRIVDRETNRQIAEELFLSPKTVETNVRNIFGKLGAESRVEVARIVERADRLAGGRRTT